MGAVVLAGAIRRPKAPAAEESSGRSTPSLAEGCAASLPLLRGSRLLPAMPQDASLVPANPLAAIPPLAGRIVRHVAKRAVARSRLPAGILPASSVPPLCLWLRTDEENASPVAPHRRAPRTGDLARPCVWLRTVRLPPAAAHVAA